MILKNIAAPNLDFFSAEAKATLFKRFPVFAEKIQNTELLAELVEQMSQGRLNQLINNDLDLVVEPLEYSRLKKIGLSLGGQEYITPYSHSFRRQILFSKEHDQAYELLIPGQPSRPGRELITRARLDFYQIINQDPASLDRFQPVHGFVEVKQNLPLVLYNEPIEFSVERPLGLMIYDYSEPWRGLRIGNEDQFDHAGNMSLAYFEKVLPGLGVKEVVAKIHSEISLMADIMHRNLLAGSKSFGNSGTTEMHLANFLLTLQGKAICVMDACGWFKVSSVEEAVKLDDFPLSYIKYSLGRMAEWFSDIIEK